MGLLGSMVLFSMESSHPLRLPEKNGHGIETFLRDCEVKDLKALKDYYESDRSKIELKLLKTGEYLKTFKDLEKAMSKLEFSSEFLKDKVSKWQRQLVTRLATRPTKPRTLC